MFVPSLLAALGLAIPSALAQQAGSFVTAGDTLVSAMMLRQVYIIDKVEGNAHQINGHSAYASVWDINTRTATAVDVQTNPFCAAGMHLPNASFAVFGGNGAVGPGGNIPPRAIRIITSCDGDLSSPPCSWFDGPNTLMMAKERWYPGAEALANGSVVLIGGFTAGGYINRALLSQPTSSTLRHLKLLNHEFMVKQVVSILRFDIPHAIGKMFVQANYSTILWDYDANVETPLPDMPGQISMPDADWGNYTCPQVNTWTIPASSQCHRITPEPTDGSSPTYVQDDSLPIGRTMGHSLHSLTALYLSSMAPKMVLQVMLNRRSHTSFGAMPFGESLASGPVGQPAIYNPKAAPGSRWSTADSPRATKYPQTLSYGGNPFDITIPSSSYSGSSNDAAANTTVWLIRQGFTTHAMNMGQRIMQLNNTFTVQSNGTITLHTAQLPPIPALFQPGPAFLFVTIDGIPSNGTYVVIGNGQIGAQPTAAASVLPPSVLSSQGSKSTGSGSGSGNGKNRNSVMHVRQPSIKTRAGVDNKSRPRPDVGKQKPRNLRQKSNEGE
ncbi:glyoxal oxidase N-terminus-domain-containing protein [Russula vinacea]|nr:glyoxal oxidase N-terminus-domain-containing protein [Russula vinacea]